MHMCVIYVSIDLFQSAYIGIFTQELWSAYNADSAKPGTGWKLGHNMMLESYLACGADAKTPSQQGAHNKSFHNVYRWPKNYRKPEAALAAQAKQVRKKEKASKKASAQAINTLP